MLQLGADPAVVEIRIAPLRNKNTADLAEIRRSYWAGEASYDIAAKNQFKVAASLGILGAALIVFSGAKARGQGQGAKARQAPKARYTGVHTKATGQGPGQGQTGTKGQIHSRPKHRPQAGAKRHQEQKGISQTMPFKYKSLMSLVALGQPCHSMRRRSPCPHTHATRLSAKMK